VTNAEFTERFELTINFLVLDLSDHVVADIRNWDCVEDFVQRCQNVTKE
jgi:hypothetical protein